jgi:hypothetical protein
MRHVVDEGNRHQRQRELERELAQRPLAARRLLHQPDEGQIEREIEEGRKEQHRPLPVVVEVDEEEIRAVDERGQDRVDVLPEDLHPGQRLVHAVERR